MQFAAKIIAHTLLIVAVAIKFATYAAAAKILRVDVRLRSLPPW